MERGRAGEHPYVPICKQEQVVTVACTDNENIWTGVVCAAQVYRELP